MKRVVILVSLLLIIVGLVACTSPEPEVVEVEKEVTKIVTEKIVETVVVEGTVQVIEKEVEVEKVVTATPEPDVKTLIVGMDLSPAYSMDPQNHMAMPGGVANSACYQTLVRISANNWNEPAPYLAESWDISEDGLTYTFYLRQDAFFASGNPITAEDVRFSFMRLKNLQGDPAGFISNVTGTEVVDEYTVNVYLGHQSASFINTLGTTYLSILDSKVVIEQGGTDSEDASTTDTATTWLDQNSAGSGPFILTRWTPRYEVVLEKNPDYWGEPAKVDKIVFRQVDDPSTAFQMVQLGDMDMILRADLDLVEQAENSTEVTAVLLESLDTSFINMTCDPELSEPLSDQRVRQAVVYAIDREGLIQSVLGGYAKNPPSIIPLGMPGVDSEKTWQLDVEKSKELLAEAGYPDGFDITYTYPTSPEYDLVAAKIQSDLAKVGINVTLEPMDFSLLISRWFESREPAMFFAHWVPDYIDYTIWTDFWGNSENNMMWVSRCENEEIENLSVQIATELDYEKRVAAAEQWQEAMMEMSYSVPLYQNFDLVIVRNNVDGFGYIPNVYTDWGIINK